jgi:hypothetical protein
MATTLRNFDNHELKIYWVTVREWVTFSHARVGKWVLDLIKRVFRRGGGDTDSRFTNTNNFEAVELNNTIQSYSC